MEITGLVDFDATGQLLVLYFAIVEYFKKWEYNEAVHPTYIDFKKANVSVRREVLYGVLIEFGMPMKLVILIQMCLKATCNSGRLGKYLSYTFCIKNGLKSRDVLWLWLFTITLDYAIRKVQKNEEGLKLNGTHHFLIYADDVNT